MYILQFICTSTAKGHLHILRPAWVIIVLCFNPSYYTGHSTSLCNTLHTAICTALGREQLQVPSSPPSKNCQVSISSTITFLKNKYFHLFCCQAVSAPCSNQQGWGQLRFNLCGAEPRLVLRSAEELREAHGLCETPLPCLFPTGNATQGQQSCGKQNHNDYL